MINKRNMVGLVAVIFMVLFSAVPAFAAQAQQTAQVTVSDTVSITALFGSTVNGTINLGSLNADGSQTTVNGELLRTYSNVNVDVWTRATGDFSGGSPADTITLSNFVYNNGTDHAFTNSYVKMITNWNKAPKNGYNEQALPLKITIPTGTNPGTYTTTIYFSALKTGSTGPPAPP